MTYVLPRASLLLLLLLGGPARVLGQPGPGTERPAPSVSVTWSASHHSLPTHIRDSRTSAGPDTLPPLPPSFLTFPTGNGPGFMPTRRDPGPRRAWSGQVLEHRTIGTGRAVLYSTLLPGLGQRLLGQGRWAAFAAMEIWSVLQYLDEYREGRELEDRYRDLAWQVARRISSGPRVEGGFEYYEALTEFRSSGAYDADPGRSGIQPEQDPDTYNGYIWVLARDIYLPETDSGSVDESSPRYQAAVDYYLSRAYAPSLAWNWGENDLQQAEYAQLIRESDENFRRATTMIGVILANHLLSAVDALITSRLGTDEEEIASLPRLRIRILPSTYAPHALAFTLRMPLF